MQFIDNAIAYLKAEAADQDPGLSLPENDSPLLNMVGNNLYAAYVVDDGQQLIYVQKRHLDEAGLDMSALHQIGMNNLIKLANEKLEIRQHGPVYGAFLDGNFEASLILIDDLWDSGLVDLVANGAVAAIPAKDVLAFCDSRSPEGIAVLRQITSRFPQGKSDHLLSQSLYRRQDRKWVIFRPT